MAEFIFIVIFVIIGLVLLGLLDEIQTGYGNDEYRRTIIIMTCIFSIIFFSMFVVMIYNFFVFYNKI